MAWLSRFIAAVLVSLITIAIIAQIFDATLLKSSYLDKTAAKAGVYSKLSTDLSIQLSKNIGNNKTVSQAQVQAIIQKVLTPQLIENKVSAALGGIEAYYKGDGPVPTISINDVIAKLNASGLPLNIGNSSITNNIVLTAFVNDKIKTQIKNFEAVRLYATLAAVVLFGVLVFLSWEEHRWKIVPDLLIIVSILLGVYATLFLVGVIEVEKYAKLDPNSNEFTAIANDFAKTLTHQIGILIAIIAVSLFVIGVTLRVYLQIKGNNKKQTISKSSKK